MVLNSTIGGQRLEDALKSGALSAATTLASQTLFKGIGDLAADTGLAEGDLRKVLLHAMAGCAVGQITQQCMAGAIGAGLQELGGDAINRLSSSPERRVQLSGLVAAAATLLVGGDAAAVNAANSVAQDARTYNRQLHEKEILKLREIAKDFAKQTGLTEQEAYQRLLVTALRTVDKKYSETHSGWDPSADAFLRQNAAGSFILEGKEVLLFTAGSKEFYQNPTLLQETWKTYETEYVLANLAEAVTKAERFRTQEQVTAVYRQFVETLTNTVPVAGPLLTTLMEYDVALQAGDQARMEEILRDLPLNMAPGVKMLSQFGKALGDRTGGTKVAEGPETTPPSGTPQQGGTGTGGTAKPAVTVETKGTTNSAATEVIAHYGPMKQGPLPNEIANTFRSGTYLEVLTTEPTTLYRVISDNGNPSGGYWTRKKPEGPLQSVIDSALDQRWGNTATRVVEMEVPTGTRLFEGFAANQRGLLGGGNQIYFDKTLNPLDMNWIKK